MTKYISEKEKYCGDCVFMKQGKSCCFCSNKNQTDENRKKYVYWSFGKDCKFYERKLIKP